MKYQYKEPYSLSNVGRKYVTDKDIAELEEVMNDETVDLNFSESGHLLPSKVVVINYAPDQSIQVRVLKVPVVDCPPDPKVTLNPYISLRDTYSEYYRQSFEGTDAITNAVAAVEARIRLSNKEVIWGPFNGADKVLIPFLDSDGGICPTTKGKFMELPYELRLELIRRMNITYHLDEVDAEDLLDPPERGPLNIYLVERTDDYTWEDMVATVVTAYTEAQAIWVSKCNGIGADTGDLKVTMVGTTDTLPPRELILVKSM